MYYTKETAKTLKIAIIPLVIITIAIMLKYKPAYEITIENNKMGFIENKKIFENEVNEYLNDTTGNVFFREEKSKPEYEFKLIDKKIEYQNDEMMLAVKNNIETTYKTYAVLVDNEEKVVVATEEEAKNSVENMKKNIDEKLLDIAIIEKYTTEFNVQSQEEANNVLTEVKKVKVANYKKELANKKKALAIAEAKTKQNITVGSIAGIALTRPINGIVTSRFGSRDAKRSGAHTGLDISASTGTTITPIASGTVTFAGYKGSYGNLVIIDHGNGIESYYAHCSQIYTSVGQQVDSNTAISAVGSTGNSTGPHLHVEIRQNGVPLNPEEYLY